MLVNYINYLYFDFLNAAGLTILTKKGRVF